MDNIILSDTYITRFWSHVDRRGDDECWLWTGLKWGNPHDKDNMYGCLAVMAGEWGNRRQTKVRAHRISFYLHNGHWPQHNVLHSCDNPLCVNPAHLRDGTHKENTEDMTKKNRHGGRFEVGHAGIRTSRKLTYEMAQQIRAEHVPHKHGGQKSSETSIKGLARKYGVSQKLILNVIRGLMWAEP